MRLHNPEADFELPFQSCGTFVPESQPYTFSVYLRSDVEQFHAALSIGWGEKRAIAVSDRWQRYNVTYLPSGEAKLRYALPVHIWLLQTGNLWVAAPQLETGAQPTTFSLALMDDHPLPTLPWGDKDDQTMFSSEVSPPPVRAVESLTEHATEKIGIDSVRRCLVKDGKPLLISAIAVSNPDDRQLDDVAKHGFNAVSIFISVTGRAEDDDQSLALARARLDSARARGLGVVPMFILERRKPLAQLNRDIANAITRLKDHPAILSWLVLDEPYKWWETEGKSESEVLQLYRAANGADNTRPVFINHNSWERGKGCYGGLDSTDIGSVDVYPIGQYQNPLKMIADLSQSMNVDCIRAHKPTAFWHQLHGYDDAVREPTPDEERAMTYLSLIHGTRLLFYWLYKPMNNALWESLKSLREELNRLELILLDTESRWLNVGTNALRIHYSMFQLGDSCYLIACNASPEEVRAVFEIDQLGATRSERVDRYFDGSEFVFERNTLSMTFVPYERQVFEFR